IPTRYVGTEIADAVDPLMEVKLAIDVVEHLTCANTITSRQHGFTVIRPRVDTFDLLTPDEEWIPAAFHTVLGFLGTSSNRGEYTDLFLGPRQRSHRSTPMSARCPATLASSSASSASRSLMVSAYRSPSCSMRLTRSSVRALTSLSIWLAMVACHL